MARNRPKRIQCTICRRAYVLTQERLRERSELGGRWVCPTCLARQAGQVGRSSRGPGYGTSGL